MVVSGLDFFKLSLVIVEPPVPGLLVVRLMPGGGGIVPPVIPQIVQILVSVSPPLVLIRSLTSPGRGLPPFVFQMVQIVFSLLFVPPGFVKCSDGFLWFPAEFLNEISGDQIARPVEAVGAVDTYQASLSLSFRDRGVESLHAGLTRDGAVAFHADLDVTEAKLTTVVRSVVAVCVGQVHDVFQLRNRFLQLL